MRDRMRPRGADPCQAPTPSRRLPPAAMRREGVRDGAARPMTGHRARSVADAPRAWAWCGKTPDILRLWESYWGAYVPFFVALRGF